MEYVLLLYVYYCTGILPLPTILSNCPVGNWHSIVIMSQFLDWFSLFVQYNVDSIILVPNAFIKYSINLNANLGPLSLRTFHGTSCIFQICLDKFFVIFSNDTFVIITLSQIICVNWSTMTTIASFLFDFGNGPIISMLISCYSLFGISNGCSSPAFFIYYTLFCWHLKYP